jgi:hypothetical protein
VRCEGKERRERRGYAVRLTAEGVRKVAQLRQLGDPLSR